MFLFLNLPCINRPLHGLSPEYIRELLSIKPVSSRSKRSDNKTLLVVPIATRSATATYGDRNFRFVGPSLWYKLPAVIRNCDNVDIFKRHLKTHLFKDAFY